MTILGIHVDVLTPVERRVLANALLRTALEDTRILLLGLVLLVDDAALGGAR